MKITDININYEFGRRVNYLRKLQKITIEELAFRCNLNKNYQPRSNTEDPNKYDASIAFEFKGQYAHTFKEVIGYGPINLIDDKDQLLLYLNYVNPSVKGGYKGPLLHGKNLSALNSEDEFEIENNYKTISKIMSKRGESNQRHLFTSKETFEKLCQVFTENEYRIYLVTDKRVIEFVKSSRTRITELDLSNMVRVEKQHLLNGNEYYLLGGIKLNEIK